MTGSSIGLALQYCLGLVAFLGLLEIIVRRKNLDPIVTRRIAHVISGLFALFIWNYFSPLVFITCALLLTCFIIISYIFRLLSSVHAVKRKTYGEIYLPLGIITTYFVSSGNSELFVPAVLVMTFSDSLAGVISDLRRQHRPSNLGSIGYFICTLAILLNFGTDLGQASAVAFVSMVVEKISNYGSDNLSVPVTVAVLLLL